MCERPTDRGTPPQKKVQSSRWSPEAEGNVSLVRQIWRSIEEETEWLFADRCMVCYPQGFQCGPLIKFIVNGRTYLQLSFVQRGMFMKNILMLKCWIVHVWQAMSSADFKLMLERFCWKKKNKCSKKHRDELPFLLVVFASTSLIMAHFLTFLAC